MTLTLHRGGGFVVHPDGRAQGARGLGGEGLGVTGGVAEADHDVAVQGVERFVGEQIGLGDGLRGGRRSRQSTGAAAVQDAAVRGREARDGLDVPEFGVAEPEALGERGAVVRVEAVGALGVRHRFEDDHAPARSDEGGAGAQQFVECCVQRAGPGQAFGQLVQGREIGDPSGQPVLEHRAGRGGQGGQRVGSVRGVGDCRVDSSHFRQVRGAHGSRLSDWCVSLNSIANPHVILRRYQCIHMYTHKEGDVQHWTSGIGGV